PAPCAPPGCRFCCPAAARPALGALSLHDALPIFLPPLRPLSVGLRPRPSVAAFLRARRGLQQGAAHSLPLGVDADLFPISSKKEDRKSTRLTSSHVSTSYAVFCLNKKPNRHAARH